MWIFAKQGFASVVQDRFNPGSVLVRGRAKGDLIEVLEGMGIAGAADTVKHTPAHDYPYRATISQESFAKGMFLLAKAVDYTNFKGKVAQVDDDYDCIVRGQTYHQVWSTLHNLELLNPDEERRDFRGDFGDELDAYIRDEANAHVRKD
jgi:hypothetical protein